ncbi:DUF2585 family protein [Candidatus Kaiserbacteria bacterium]|nr:DUF2585 family protein [Candidatus Kaiserbacteria bacterium]
MTRSLGIVVALVLAQGAVLFFFGQPPICACGYIEFWHGEVLSPGNSQHLTDWYTFSHVIHGIIFYYLAGYLFPKFSAASRLALAVGVEVAWEIAENTPMVIQHYREQALAQGYTGDSIINSVSDTFAMMFGFLIASRFAVWVVVTLALLMELYTLYMIRDNLALNIVNLIHAFPSIAAWQAGAQ